MLFVNSLQLTVWRNKGRNKICFRWRKEKEIGCQNKTPEKYRGNWRIDSIWKAAAMSKPSKSALELHFRGLMLKYVLEPICLFLMICGMWYSLSSNLKLFGDSIDFYWLQVPILLQHKDQISIVVWVDNFPVFARLISHYPLIIISLNSVILLSSCHDPDKRSSNSW